MNKIKFIQLVKFLLAMLLPTNSFAEISNDNNYFNLLCIGDQSVGFNWEKGDWVENVFNPSKYLVKKLEIIKPDYERYLKTGFYPKSGECWTKKKRTINSIPVKPYTFSLGCYNIRKAGSDLYSKNSELCSEAWKVKKNKKKYLVNVQCKNFKFNPSGWFHSAVIHSDTRDDPRKGDVDSAQNDSKHGNKDYKGSLAISVGKCLTL